MRLAIQGQPVEAWPPEVWAKWHDVTDELPRDQGAYSQSNYFTPRPPRNDFDRGHDHEGFCYTVGFRRVCIVYVEPS